MYHYAVAPFTGAWIEIAAQLTPGPGDIVAPFTGAWIEMRCVISGWPIRMVAPFTGAWIEIFGPMSAKSWLPSLPSRERGLKLNQNRLWEYQGHVAPFTGAWIEITGRCAYPWGTIVAPFTGAWIEICGCYIEYSLVWSLPSRERGLKYDR